MTRRSSGLILVLLGLPAAARAAEDGGACTAEKAEAIQLRQSLAACSADGRTTAERAAHCETARDEARHEVQTLSGSLQACQGERERTCDGAAALAEAVVRTEKGATAPTVPGCVSPAQQAAVAQVLDGHATAASLLADLVAYLSGATDVPPQPRASNPTALRGLVDRLVGSGRGIPPLSSVGFSVESFERIAPRFWRRLVASGRENINRWLAAAGPLDESAVAEIRAGIAAGKLAASGASLLESSLRGVEVYRDLAGCARRALAPRACGRARELQRLLENSGPLLVRQRIQEIRENPCRLGQGVALAWIRDLPASSVELGRAEWQQIAVAAREKMFSCYLAEILIGEASPPTACCASQPGPSIASRSRLA